MSDTYTSFEARFLVALYLQSEEVGDDYITSGPVLERFRLDYKPHWIMRALAEYEGLGYVQQGLLTHDSGHDQNVALTAAGAKEAERLLDEGIVSQVDQPPPLAESTASEVDGTNEIPTAIPAAGRLVPLNHNLPEYQEIADGLADLCEQVRGDNEVGETAEERDRLLRSLRAAQELWAATELHLIQIRVGVVLAVEDATSAITKLGKAVGAGLLADLIKRFVKHATGFDF